MKTASSRPTFRQRIAHWLASGTQHRRFEAARVDRITSAWLAENASINQELRGDLDRLRARGRQLVKNNDYARKFVGMCQNNIVGPAGFVLQARVADAPDKPDRLANQAIEDAFAEWAAACDVTGTMSLRDVCETLIGALPSDGEFLCRFVVGAEAGNRFGFALQPIDVDRIDTTYHSTTTEGNQVVMGVERNAFGRALAVWIFEGHPNDGPNTNRQRIRVPVDEVLHRFKIDTPGQARGIPWMAPGMLSLHHLGGFKLSALLAAEHGANHYGFFMTPDGAPPIGGAEDDSGAMITTTQPGTFDTLPTGVDFKPFESKYPSETFGPFVKVTLQRIASGWRVAYHSLANDLEGVNFSSIRSGTLEERDRWSSDQQWFIGAFLDPMYAKWLQVALLRGAITMPNGSPLPAAKYSKFAKHEWQPRRWDWVDPKSDLEAKILGVRAGLMAPQDLAAQMGFDFDDTLAKIKQAYDMADAYGFALTAYESTPGAMSASVTPAEAQAADAAKAKALQEQQAQRSAQDQRQEQLQQAILASLARGPAPITINQGPVNVTTPEVRVDNHLPAPEITAEIRNEITVPETTVNVEAVMPEAERAAAPQVMVQVQPAPVTVVEGHPVSSVQTVERDAKDEITRTVTTYQFKEQ